MFLKHNTVMNTSTSSRYSIHEDSPNTRTPRSSTTAANRSARSSTSSSVARQRVNPDTTFVVSLTENRVKEVLHLIQSITLQVGICAIDLHSPELQLSQFSDTETYLHTCSKLYFYDPVEVRLFQHSNCSRSSFQTLPKALNWQNFLEYAYPLTSITFSLRPTFPIQRFPPSKESILMNLKVKVIFLIDSSGMMTLKELVIPEMIREMELECSSKYLCLAATAALVKYVQHIQAFHFATNTLKVRSISLRNITGFCVIHGQDNGLRQRNCEEFSTPVDILY